MNIAEIVENGGSFSGEEFTICDPKRNKGVGRSTQGKKRGKTTGNGTTPATALRRLAYIRSHPTRRARPHYGYLFCAPDDDVENLSVLLILFC
ncbi:hypothetical protein ACNKCP_000674 [Cronobacter dublinensis]